MVRSDLWSARTTVINLVATARAAAVQSNRLTWVKFEGNSAYVIARPRLSGPGGALVEPCDTVGAVQDLSAQYKVGPARTRSASIRAPSPPGTPAPA